MDRHLEEADYYKANKDSKIKCKNCGNYIPEHLLKECEQENGNYLCPDCKHELNSEEINRNREK